MLEQRKGRQHKLSLHSCYSCLKMFCHSFALFNSFLSCIDPYIFQCHLYYTHYSGMRVYQGTSIFVNQSRINKTLFTPVRCPSSTYFAASKMTEMCFCWMRRFHVTFSHPLFPAVSTMQTHPHHNIGPVADPSRLAFKHYLVSVLKQMIS